MKAPCTLYSFTDWIEALLLTLHGLSFFAVKAKIHGVLYNQSGFAFDKTSSYWSAQKNS